MRRNPEIFPTRVIFNQFISREFRSEEELLQAVKARLALFEGEGSERQAQDPAAERIKSMATSLSRQTGCAVSLRGTEEKGTLSIRYLNPHDLQRITQALESLEATQQ